MPSWEGSGKVFAGGLGIAVSAGPIRLKMHRLWGGRSRRRRLCIHICMAGFSRVDGEQGIDGYSSSTKAACFPFYMICDAASKQAFGTVQIDCTDEH